VRQGAIDYGPMKRRTPDRLPLLISRTRIARRVRQLGLQITRDFRGESVLLVGVLKGACIFLADLSREISLDASFDFLAAASYGESSESSGQVRLVKDLDTNIAGRNVILVEDILDTGVTLNYLLGLLRQRRPKALRVAVLLDKADRRIQPIEVHYLGFRIPNDFVVGYGLDYAERYRNLKDIRVIHLAGEAAASRRPARQVRSAS
jgi:hypoxanthine phosphoribosyltransferase